MDALTVGADVLYKVLNARPEMENQTVQKRVILVSNFLEPVSPAKLKQLERACPDLNLVRPPHRPKPLNQMHSVSQPVAL